MARTERALIVVCLAIGWAGAPVPAGAWGFAGHRMVNRKAAGTLPRPLRELFVGNLDYLAERSIDPDLQRSGPADPDHFLDMDAFGAYPFPGIAKDETAHLARFGEKAREKGRLPWKVGEAYRGLVEAFGKGDAPLVLSRAGSLAHYIADAHVPLHAALNHDGQLTGQRGLHGRWESTLLERHQRDLEASVLPGAAALVADPVSLTFDVLRSSYLHSVEVLASDKASAGPRDLPETSDDDRYDDAYYSKMYEREASRLRARLSSAASAVGSLWLSAWQDAGSPTLDASYRVPYLRHRERAVLLSLDGSAAPLLDDAVSRGVMPHLAALRRRGATASGSLSTLPPKTAAGHAALYTGAWSDVNGIADNDVAVPGGAVTEWGDGYSALYLRAEPLWAAAARQDLGVTVVSATQVWPFSRYFDPQLRFPGWYSDKLTLFDGYQSVETGDRVYATADLPPRPAGEWLGALPRHAGEVREIAMTDLGVTIDGLLYDDPDDPIAGFDTLYLGLDRDPRTGVTLKPHAVRTDASAFAGLAVPLAGGDSGVFFRLFALAPDGSELLLYRSAAHVLRSNKGRLEAAAFEATGGFMGNGASRSYRAGRLGRTLPDGGDGMAERRYLETVALTIRQFGRLEEFACSRTAWELLITYLPYPDEALHEWYGYLDPTLAGRNSAIGDRLQPFADEVLRQADAHLGRLVDRVGPDVTIAVGSDHGMVGVNRMALPNVALARAGLLSVDGTGAVDPAGTRALYGPGNFISINRRSRPGGIVAPEEEPALRRRITEVLRSLKDPDTGRPVILDVLDPRTTTGEPRFGGPTGGDLYLVPAEGYLIGKGLKGDPVGPLPPRGEHFLDPRRPSMQAGFAIAGPGIAPGISLGPIRQIDVAPTLAAVLGLEPPAQSSGAVLESALARKAPRPPTR